MKFTNIIIAVAFTGMLAIAAFSADNQKTLTGIVSDNMCGKQHMAKDRSAAQCTRECVKAGSDYALVVADKVYTLKGDKAQIDKFAGEKATVAGDLSGDIITVSSISAVKK